MAQPQPHPQLQVAIVGAGIAGLAAAIALKDHPGIRVQLYERATALREIGASIALGPNGMRTLERLGVTSALDDSIAFRNPSGHPMVYRHYLTGEVVSTDARQDHIDRRHRTARFYRAHLQEALLAELLDAVPIHLGKTFAAAVWDDARQQLVLRFADDTTATADMVLGADGIRSAVRSSSSSSSSSSSLQPRWTGWLALRSVFPREHVAHVAGLPEEATHVWGPHGDTLFFSPLGRGLFTVVGSLQVADPDDPDSPHAATAWAEQGQVDTLRDLYRTWGPLARAVVAATPSTQLYPNAAAVPHGLSSWSLGPRGRFTLAGDAAHAHGGAFAAGGSLALDDAWAFAAALRHVFPVSGPAAAAAAAAAAAVASPPTDVQIATAIALYEKTRKAHTDRVVRLVHDGNLQKRERAKAQAAGTAAEETDEQLRDRMRNRVDPAWIHEHDVQAAFTSALHELQAQPDSAPASAKI